MTADNIRIQANWSRPSAALLERFRGHSSANLGDAMERMGMVDGGIVPIYAGAAFAGSALPVLAVAGDNLGVIEALEHIRPGDVVVVNAQGHDGRAVIGDNLAQRFEIFGAVGAVVDGAVRDRDIIERLQFPVFARHLTPAGPFKNGPGVIGEPVAIGRVVVSAGDIVVADSDGIIVVPQDRAEEVLAAADGTVELERSKDAEAAELRATRDEAPQGTRLWAADRVGGVASGHE